MTRAVGLIRTSLSLFALFVILLSAEGPVAAAAAGTSQEIHGLLFAIRAEQETATLIAQLVDEGKLQWSTPVAQALPECGSTMRPEYQEVTVADLLAHESGLPPFDQEKELKAIPPGTGSPTAQRLEFSCLALSRPSGRPAQEGVPVLERGLFRRRGDRRYARKPEGDHAPKGGARGLT